MSQDFEVRAVWCSLPQSSASVSQSGQGGDWTRWPLKCLRLEMISGAAKSLSPRGIFTPLFPLSHHPGISLLRDPGHCLLQSRKGRQGLQCPCLAGEGRTWGRVNEGQRWKKGACPLCASISLYHPNARGSSQRAYKPPLSQSTAWSHQSRP